MLKIAQIDEKSSILGHFDTLTCAHFPFRLGKIFGDSKDHHEWIIWAKFKEMRRRAQKQITTFTEKFPHFSTFFILQVIAFSQKLTFCVSRILIWAPTNQPKRSISRFREPYAPCCPTKIRLFVLNVWISWFWWKIHYISTFHSFFSIFTFRLARYLGIL